MSDPASDHLALLRGRVESRLEPVVTRKSYMRHIVVTGAKASGKSATALALAQKYHLPVAHLDDHPLWRQFISQTPAALVLDNRRPGSLYHAAYHEARRRVTAEALFSLREPHVVEGVQALAAPHLLAGHLVLLLYLPPSINVGRIVSLALRRGELTGAGDPRYADGLIAARRLYLEAAREMLELADLGPGRDVWAVNDPEDVNNMDEDQTVTTCGRCGRVVPCSYGPDPYESEINEDYTPVWLCEDCYQARADDV